MVKIFIEVLSGVYYDRFLADWSPRVPTKILEEHYKQNKKNYVVGYKFELGRCVLKVNKIEEKAKPKITFSC